MRERVWPSLREAGPTLPLEGWQRLLERVGAWAGRHAVVVARLVRLRTVLGRVALAGYVVLAVVEPRIRQALVVPASGLAMLAVLLVLARTRTVSRSMVGLWFSLSCAWAVVIAGVTTWTSQRLGPWFSSRPYADLIGMAVGGDGPGTAVAALGEECLKLVPLAVLAVVAAGRVRRFSRVDWLLLGYVGGLGFMVVEESARAWVLVVRPGLLDALLVDERSGGFTWWPFGFRGFALTGEVPAWYAGHQVLTALTATAVGVGVWWWRRGGFGSRVAAVALPLSVWWVSVSDHFGYNATSSTPLWLTDPDSGAPAVLRWTFRVTGHGWGRSWVLVVALVVVLLADMAVLRLPTDLAPEVVRRAPRGSGGASAVVGVVVRRTVDLVARTRVEWAVILDGYRVRSGQSRASAMWCGSVAMQAIREDRVQAFAGVSEQDQAQRGGVPAVVRSRRRVRWVAVVVAVALMVLGVVVAAWLAARIGPLLVDATRPWLAGLFDRLAGWWHGLPWWGQVLIGLAAVLGVVLLTLATGGTVLAGLGTGLSVAGIGSYLGEHGGDRRPGA